MASSGDSFGGSSSSHQRITAICSPTQARTGLPVKPTEEVGTSGSSRAAVWVLFADAAHVEVARKIVEAPGFRAT
ncbi:hypothetical protein [Saccharopolyspora pogona]|uniref:hypothetical protein n=1 Tax=Saccharopolyspora pogona TaxID=333966 RepID=UPI001CC2686E|nr:hypothetical protein [Saccharopolyspora pogona]